MNKKQNNKELKRLLSSDDLSSFMSELEDCDIKGKEEVWARVNPATKRASLRKRMPLIAASIMLLISLNVALLKFVSHNNDFVTVETAELLTPQEVILPDGTKVFLNSYSTLVYPKHFEGKERLVSFDGLAYFSVAKDSEHPFIIDAPESRVKVLGTQFSLNAYKGSRTEKVFLEEGSVALFTKSEELLLRPGEIATVDVKSNQLTKKVNLNRNMTSWKTRQLVFDNDPIDYVLEELEKYYGKAIVLEDRTILNLRFNAHFDHASVDEMLQVLSYTLDLKYTVNGNTILLTSNK